MSQKAYPNNMKATSSKSLTFSLETPPLRRAMAAARQLLHLAHHHNHSCSPCQSHQASSASRAALSGCRPSPRLPKLEFSVRESRNITRRVSAENGGLVSADGDDGVSLGTMKLPVNTDVPRFEALLFQWANSLCQGATLPLPVPLKVDKVQGGARLGFISVDDGKTEVLVNIDCLVFPATESSGPLFRAIRSGPMGDQAAPGESRIMRSLLQALQKSAEIAKI